MMKKKPKDKDEEPEKDEEIPSKSSKATETGKIITEDIKAEIYQIAEVVLDEKVRDFEKRISELELAKAQNSQKLSELEEEAAELRSAITKQKIGSAEQLVRINDQLNSLAGNISAMQKVVVGNLNEVQRALSEMKK